MYGMVFTMVKLVTLVWKTKVDKLGRTSIPAEIRKRLGIKENDEIIWILENGRAYIIKRMNIKVDEVIDWLRTNAPECFTSKEKTEDRDKWGMDKEWAMKKLGMRE